MGADLTAETVWGFLLETMDTVDRVQYFRDYDHMPHSLKLNEATC